MRSFFEHFPMLENVYAIKKGATIKGHPRILINYITFKKGKVK